jgi:hypothetical protein
MPPIDHVDQTGAQEIVLFLGARVVLHGQNQNCRDLNATIQNPADRGEKNCPVSKRNQRNGNCSGRTKQYQPLSVFAF